ncbi:MAG: hypothetical protein A2X64_09910 [Ignavibacteria bacterium GWF2_33_9]|nr:MAG: hypothetical protein A2X64_09910 [Ignavibacteria bacterium GWF2_33_9]
MIKNIYAFLLILTLELIFNNFIFAQTGKWTQLFPQNSPEGRDSHGMAYLGDDKILLFGGTDKYNLLSDTWIYDLSENTWTEVICDTFPRACEYPAMSYIDVNKAFLFGGQTLEPSKGYSDSTWIFDLDKMKWQFMAPIRHPYKRYRSACTYMGNNKILLHSGELCPDDFFCSDTWIYDLRTNNWDSIATDKVPSGETQMMCQLDSENILLYGGWWGGYIPEIYFFNKETYNYKLIKPNKDNIWRSKSAMVNLIDGIALTFGGDTYDVIDSIRNQFNNDTWLFNIKDTTWIELKPENIPPRRYWHNMVKIGEGKAILFGGIGAGYLNDTWLFEYDPTSIKEDGTNKLIDFIQKRSKIEINLKENNNYIIEIQIFDYLGNLIRIINVNSNHSSINTLEFPNGIYILQVITKKFNWNKIILNNK